MAAAADAPSGPFNGQTLLEQLLGRVLRLERACAQGWPAPSGAQGPGPTAGAAPGRAPRAPRTVVPRPSDARRRRLIRRRELEGLQALLARTEAALAGRFGAAAEAAMRRRAEQHLAAAHLAVGGRAEAATVDAGHPAASAGASPWRAARSAPGRALPAGPDDVERVAAPAASAPGRNPAAPSAKGAPRPNAPPPRPKAAETRPNATTAPACPALELTESA